MYKILIVEDITEKLKNIILTLVQVNGIVEDNIHHVVDVMDAKKALLSTHFDLLILDISVPLRKSEKVDPEGGVKLLEEILSRQKYKIPAHIIGVTAYDKVFDKVYKQFQNQTLTVLKYSNSDIEWQTALKNGVEQKITSKQSTNLLLPSYNYDVAIITAIEKEYQAVKVLSKEWRKLTVSNDASPYYETIFERDGKNLKVVACYAPQMGMNASSVLSTKLIYNFRPRYLIMVGIAASIKESLSHGFGDVLVVDESWDGGAGKITEGESGECIFLQTASHIRLDNDTLEQIRGLKEDRQTTRKIKDEWKGGNAPNTELNIHIGSVVSVAGVIENSAVISELQKKDRKLLGLDMETFGVYYAAKNASNPKPIAISFKAVSDFANIKKNDEFQHYACYTSANVMFEYLMQFA